MFTILFPIILLLSPLGKSDMIPEHKDTKSSLQYLVREPKRSGTKGKAIVLLHGVGSNEQDLFSLADHLPDNFYVISARGPITLGAGSYAWYEVDFSSGAPVFNTAQEAQSRKLIIQFIEQVKAEYGIQDMYIGGFSQGAIMSYSVGLTRPELVKGVLALSGRILTEIRPSIHPGKALAGLRVMVAHGTTDATLPIGYAREAKEYLQKLNLNLSYHEYPLGHQINEQVIVDMTQFLSR